MAQQNLSIDEIMSKKNPPVIKPGKYEKVLLKSYEKMTVNKNTFIRFTFKLADNRELSDNRFAQGLGIMISHLREQLKLQDVEISGTELFEKCKTQPFTLWVEKTTIVNANTGLSQRVTNVHFLEPLNSVSSEEKSEETTTQIQNDDMPE